ncbi:MAG TPA: amino acid adenylation domain-containing protein [Kofleriaceae bacterium]|nr:amino acid adenylation domain-containing protein [Kofleriaceae bacterium]
MAVLTPVHELLRASAARVPDKLALVGTDITYRALATRAGALAGAFIERGVAPGDRVVVWLPKSAEYVISIYAALEAGAAYVPLDATQPVARVAAILRDSEPKVLVTTAALLANVELPPSITTVYVVGGAAAPHLAFEDAVRAKVDGPRREVELSHLAAILYTSGSTGTPKGVMISHENLANFIAWARGEMDLRETDVFSNHASFNFDLSTFDLFAAMAVGAALWIVPDRITRNAAALADGIATHRITVWYSVPSALTLLLDSGLLTAEVVTSMRYLLFAGEVFPIKQLRRLKELVPSTTRLYNLYGPTETNVCTFYRVDEIDPDRPGPVPIGRPITGAHLRVVDEQGKSPPAGGTGELVVAGPCVTPGYFRRPNDPNAANHRRNCHATGDLVGYEGEDLVYRGRADRMVKVAGFRVELGEIEAALLRHTQVAEAAVLALDSEVGTRLVAFCSPGDLTLLELKTHCGELLPRYMIPHSVVRLPSLPKNPNGKIDYVQLRATATASG